MLRFDKYSVFRGFSDQERLRLMAVLLRDEASDWYDNLEDAIKQSWLGLKDAFEQRFQHSEVLRWRKASDLWQRAQGVGESVDSYITSVRKLAKAVGVTGEQLRHAIQKGLRPQILAHVIQAQPTTVDDLVKAARVAEAAYLVTATATASADVPLDRVVAELAANRIAAEQYTTELKKFTGQLSKTHVGQVSASRSPSPQRATAPRRVTFADSAQQSGRQQSPGRGRGSAPFRRTTTPGQPTTMTPPMTCGYCGGKHQRGRQYCRAADVECFLCKRIGHFARVCRSARRQDGASASYNSGGPPNFSA